MVAAPLVNTVLSRSASVRVRGIVRSMSLAWSCCRFGSLASTFDLVVPAALAAWDRQSSPDAVSVSNHQPRAAQAPALESLSTSDQFVDSLYPGTEAPVAHRHHHQYIDVGDHFHIEGPAAPFKLIGATVLADTGDRSRG